MSELHDRLSADLTTALRARDRDAVRVLRTVLSAISNAEAPPGSAGAASLPSGGPIAGAVEGLGATEVDRRVLDDDQVRAIVEGEHAERVEAAEDLESRGANDPAAVLRREAEFLELYL
jgi:uncharacterized protein YqeY